MYVLYLLNVKIVRKSSQKLKKAPLSSRRLSAGRKGSFCRRAAYRPRRYFFFCPNRYSVPSRSRLILLRCIQITSAAMAMAPAVDTTTVWML